MIENWSIREMDLELDHKIEINVDYEIDWGWTALANGMNEWMDGMRSFFLEICGKRLMQRGMFDEFPRKLKYWVKHENEKNDWMVWVECRQSAAWRMLGVDGWAVWTRGWLDCRMAAVNVDGWSAQRLNEYVMNVNEPATWMIWVKAVIEWVNAHAVQSTDDLYRKVKKASGGARDGLTVRASVLLKRQLNVLKWLDERQHPLQVWFVSSLMRNVQTIKRADVLEMWFEWMKKGGKTPAIRIKCCKNEWTIGRLC
jgi:hypothetical protein